MKNTKPILIFKYTVYVLLLLILYVLQATPGLFVLFGAKPMLLIPVALAIAMHEGEFSGGLYGAFAGLLCDIGSSLLFGFNGLFTAVFCIAAGLVVIYLMHCNVGGAMLFTLCAMLIRGMVEYFFGYGMWGYENAWKVLVHNIFPVVIYTTVISPLLFWLVRAIHRGFAKRLTRE